MKPRTRTILLIVAILVVIGVVGALLSTSSSGPPNATTKSTTTLNKHHTTTTPAESATNLEQAVTVSRSVAFQALYISKSSRARVTAANITTAAKPDRGVLVVLKNLGEITSSPQEVVFEWKLGGSPIVVCLVLPTVRSSTSALTSAEISHVTCTKNFVPKKDQVDNPTTKSS